MGAAQSGRKHKREIRPKFDLPWIQQVPTSEESGSDDFDRLESPFTPGSAVTMAEREQAVFENSIYIFVVFGASVSCLMLVIALVTLQLVGLFISNTASMDIALMV